MTWSSNYILGTPEEQDTPTVRWHEIYEPVLEMCEWVTEAMLENNKIYSKLGQVFETVIRKHCNSCGSYTRERRYATIHRDREVLSIKLEKEWKIINTK